MVADASEALRYYGEKLNIRRPSLHLRDSHVQVHRVRLIYEGGALKPMKPDVLTGSMNEAQSEVHGVEVLFE
jgi:argininosuccinate synthase